MTRRIVETARLDQEEGKLMIVTVYEEGINKESVKKMNIFSKKHRVLIPSGGRYEFK